MPDADRAASTLAGIRERHAERIKNAPGLGADPVGFARLLAAIEAVQELAWALEHLEIVPPSGKEDEATVLGLRWCAAKIREAITTALQGEETGDDGHA